MLYSNGIFYFFLVNAKFFLNVSLRPKKKVQIGGSNSCLVSVKRSKICYILAKDNSLGVYGVQCM